MLAVKKTNNRLSLSRLGAVVGLLGLGACFGTFGYRYGKQIIADQKQLTKGGDKYTYDHNGIIILEHSRDSDPYMRRKLYMMLGSVKLIHHVGLLIPVGLTSYSLSSRNFAPDKRYDNFPVKSIMKDARNVWKKISLSNNVVSINCLNLSPASLIAFAKSATDRQFSLQNKSQALKDTSKALMAIRELQHASRSPDGNSLMSAFESLSRPTAASDESVVVGGIILGSKYAASFDMEAPDDNGFKTSFLISSEFPEVHETVSDEIVQLIEKLRTIKLPKDFLESGTGSASASDPKALDAETMTGEEYLAAINELRKILQEYLRLDMVQESWYNERLHLNLHNGNQVLRIWFLKCAPNLKPLLYKMAVQRRALYTPQGSMAVKGQIFEPLAPHAWEHCEKDCKFVDNFTAFAKSQGI